MGRFATGVAVLAVADGGVTRAMTVNSLTSVSLDPLLLLVCVNRQARLAPLLAPGAPFSVSLLREGQQDLSAYFAGAWREPEPPPHRFLPWGDGVQLEGCLAALAATVQARLDGGDHWIVTGRVTALHQGPPPARPLVFFGGRYRGLDAGEIPA